MTRDAIIRTTDTSLCLQVEDVHAGLHPGLRAPGNLTNNQCGIVVERASEGHAGKWTCRALLDGQALRGSIRAAVGEGG